MTPILPPKRARALTSQAKRPANHSRHPLISDTVISLPRIIPPLNPILIDRIKTMRAQGHRLREIADACEVSLGCVSKYARGVAMPHHKRQEIAATQYQNLTRGNWRAV